MNVALVFGASSGMGAELSRLLSADNGVDKLILVARRENMLKELADSFDKPTEIIVADLSFSSGREELHRLLKEEKAEISYLVNCAGVGYYGDFSEIDREKHSNTVSLNCEALTDLTYISLPYVKEGGRILLLSSAAAFLPQAKFAVYAASKSYVLSFSYALGKELKKRRISVTVACPGPVDTEFIRKAYECDVPKAKKKFCADCKIVCRAIYKGALKRKKVVVPTFSMKVVRFLAKILPHSLIMRFN